METVGVRELKSNLSRDRITSSGGKVSEAVLEDRR